MKTRLLGGLVACLILVNGLLAGSRDAAWQRVTEAEQKGLPKTAINELELISQDALADHAYAEAIKAIGLKITLEANIQGNHPEEKITRLQAELEKASPQMKPVMETILAHWYWHYYQQNRWRFMQRTQTTAAPGPDIQTWDLARILAEIDRHFTAALSDAKTLQTTPVSDYDDILQPGNVPDAYRPTMYDFLVHQALSFYQSGEQAAVKTEDEFELTAVSPIFADAAEFMTWAPTTTDEASPKLKAIRLYQSLLRFHAKDSDRSAYYDVDLARLVYGHNIATGETKEIRYKTALQRFIDTTARHEISARAIADLAGQVYLEGEFVQAHALAEHGVTVFPGGAGAEMCYNVMEQIESKSAQLETERVWNAPWPTLNVTYRNVTKVHFRAVPLDFEDHLAQAQRNLNYIDESERDKLLATTPALEWTADLPPTTDYKSRTEKLPAPTSLKPGFYYIIASHDREFDTKDNMISVAPVWVSNFALILRTQYDNERQSGFVLEAGSGTPVVGATIRLWQRESDGQFKPISPTKTDENGLFAFSATRQGVVVLAEHAGQAISSTSEVAFYGLSERDQADSHTVFFTDRAIYRPGQTINYKGVSVRFDKKAGNYSAIAGLSLTVVFHDPNGKEIARATHKTNDYGSFSGVFTAPRDRLMGRMTIQVEGRPSNTSIRVEEYKRPKFQVEINPPTEAAKLGSPVALTGKAMAYTGASIGGAKVQWRVERGVQLPYWCWWWQPPASKAIAHGTAVTDADGTFKIEFPAQPDEAVPAKNEPVFAFTIHADVTDTTGETRSEDRTVRVGYTALQASLSSAEWQTPEKPVEFAITSESLDGDPQPASGTVKFYELVQPSSVARAVLADQRSWWHFGPEEPRADPSRPESWDLGPKLAEQAFKIDATGKVKITVPLPVGIFRAMLEIKDRFGTKVTARQVIQVVDPHGAHYNVKLPDHFSAPKWSVEPGNKFTALWGTGYESGRAYVELECNGKPLQSYWTAADHTQQLIEQSVSEEMRGGFTVRITYVRENRPYLRTQVVQVPWSNKELTLKWEHFRSKLLPGQNETWTAVVGSPNAKRSAVEMVAALYDASLDQYQPHEWQKGFGVFRQEYFHLGSELQNNNLRFQFLAGWWQPPGRTVDWTYRAFPPALMTNLWNYGTMSAVAVADAPGDEMVTLSPFVVAGESDNGYRATNTLAGARIRGVLMDAASDISVTTEQFLKDTGAQNSPNLLSYASAKERGGTTPDLNKVTARKNLNETAFFFPHLLAEDDGTVKIQFTIPEALAEWKFLGFAHDKNLRAGLLTAKVVTAKDLMVEPNPPRFVREGDAIEFTVKVSNRTDQAQTGNVRLTFADAASLQPVDEALGNRAAEQAFDVPPKQSRTYSWRIAIPDGIGFLTYKAVGATKQASDGEEGFLPVLSRRILVTESLPLPVRGKTTKEFDFGKLLDSGKSDTLRNQSLTVQMVSQPAWYAVMALPYLMEYPYECSEQIFDRLYANALARHIANSDPKIRRVFDLWKGTPALDSPLVKNQDLKSVMIEETPWLREASAESEARRNVGLLFDANRLDTESTRTLAQLSDRQLEGGLWPWFPGGRSDEYITLYITTGFGRLRHLGVEVDPAPALKSLASLDAWMTDEYSRIQGSPHPEEYVPSYTDAYYLYGRSFFLKDQPVAPQHHVAVDFFLGQARKFWLQTDCRQSQAHLALALQRFGDKETPLAIMKSIKERSVSSEELGMYWRDLELSWWWYRAPIETQAMMIEAFAEVAHDAQAVEDCKVWLLKQKQTQDWKTTKATADAIYGLLLQGNSLLKSDALVEVALGGETIKPEKIEAGTGFYEQKFVRGEIKPAMGRITVKKVDDGVSWGSVHWQYLEDMAKVTPHEGTPLQLKKKLFVKETTKGGQILKPVTGPLSVGDELVVRLELHTDRDMEYIHLKDQRGSGTEPVNVLSQYKFQDGLAYYESTRDTASHFFIDYLPKGTYVFEYSTRVQLKGSYQTGIAEIQCMYAPEFNSHSESFTLEVK